MKKEYTIFAGEKLSGLVNGQYSVMFECEPDDVDSAYNSVAESCILKDRNGDSEDVVNFENCADDDVETMLKDLQRMHFLSDYEINNINE